jgi:hypothetical protein
MDAQKDALKTGRLDQAQAALARHIAWWRVDHDEYMLALRINRRNGDWAAYWTTFHKTGSPANQNRPAVFRKFAA